MPLHPEAAAFLRRRAREGLRPDHELTVAEARARADRPPERVEPVARVEDVEVPGPAGPVRARVYTPAAPPVGVVVYLHGGGHVTGTVDSYDGLTRRLANRVPATVVSVDYRRAPEHRCPAAVDDAGAVWAWAVAHADDLAPTTDRRGDPPPDDDEPRGPAPPGDPAGDRAAGGGGRVAVAGDSAGGNNAAVLTRRLRDAGATPPALQVLIYPPVDAVAYRDPDAYPSYRECGRDFGLTYPDGLAYWQHYLGPDGDPASPDASPLRAGSLAGLAPAYVLTVEFDVLRDEGEAYADALRAAGVPVRHRRWDGHLHGFLGDPDTFTDADPALTEIAGALRAALER